MFNWKKMFKKNIDQKNIPVLDDIVDEHEEESVADYPHLFSNEEKTSNEDDGLVINLNDETDSDNQNDDQNDNRNNDQDNENGNENEDENSVVIPLSSALDQTDITEADLADSDTANNDITDTHNTDNEPDDTEQLDTIVNQVVKQIMPELEQQLHKLVQQALAEKLPKEVIHSLNNGDKLSSDKD
jgi:hypothetical protein